MDDEQTGRMPLSGVRVLDLGRHLAGPTCAMFLGDLGADVIKIENPERGEDGRTSGPPFYHGESAFFLSANRNKRSLALDLKRPEGQEVFRRLAETADVVVENFRPGVMEALGIGYATMSARNPRIIYCSISGFGADGPFADRPGLDNIIQGFAGLMSVTGSEGGEPVRVGIPIADLLTGEKLQAHTSDEWERILNQHGIPCGPVYRLDQTLEHPQVRHREMVVEREHPTAGPIRLLGLPVKLSETPGAVHRVPPLLGQHTEEVLCEIGLDRGEVARLEAEGSARRAPAGTT